MTVVTVVVTVGHGKCQVPARATRCPGRSNQLFVEVFRVGLAASVSVHSGDANLGQECLPAGLFSAGTGTSRKNSGGSRHQHLSLLALGRLQVVHSISCLLLRISRHGGQQCQVVSLEMPRPNSPRTVGQCWSTARAQLSGAMEPKAPRLADAACDACNAAGSSSSCSSSSGPCRPGRPVRRPLRRPVRRPVRPMLLSVLYLCPVGRPCRDHKGIEMSRDMMRDDQF